MKEYGSIQVLTNEGGHTVILSSHPDVTGTITHVTYFRAFGGSWVMRLDHGTCGVNPTMSAVLDLVVHMFVAALLVMLES